MRDIKSQNLGLLEEKKRHLYRGDHRILLNDAPSWIRSAITSASRVKGHNCSHWNADRMLKRHTGQICYREKIQHLTSSVYLEDNLESYLQSKGNRY